MERRVHGHGQPEMRDVSVLYARTYLDYPGRLPGR
jgi:hypothetical protein